MQQFAEIFTLLRDLVYGDLLGISLYSSTHANGMIVDGMPTFDEKIIVEKNNSRVKWRGLKLLIMMLKSSEWPIDYQDRTTADRVSL